MSRIIFLYLLFFINLLAIDIKNKPYFQEKEKIFEAILFDKESKRLAKLLSDYKWDINRVKFNGKLAIEYILRNGCNLEKLKTLLKYKEVNLNLPFKNDYYYPLHFVADKNHCGENKTYIISLFLRKGAKINQKNSLGQTPLQFATMSLNLKVTDYLLTNRADFTIPTENGYPLAHYLVKSTNPKTFIERNNLYFILKLLFKRGVNIDRIYRDKTLLTLALEAKKNELAKFLLLHKAKVNIKVQNSYNIPLISALLVDLHQKNLEIIKILLRFGADIRDVDREVEFLNGKYPLLILSMIAERFDTTALLIESGANVNVKAKGENAIYWSYRNEAIYKLLKMYGAEEK